MGQESSKARRAVGKNRKAAPPVASGGGCIQQTDSSKEQGANPAPQTGNALWSHNDLVCNKMESNGDSPTERISIERSRV